MQLKRLLSYVGLSLLVLVAGCAKKKDLPPRGNLIGSAEFSPQLQFDLQSALQTDGKILDLKGHCMQMVERNDGQKVVEISVGNCPANGLVDALNIIASMKVYSEVEPGETTYLVMGNSPVLDQNTDVALFKNITEDSKSPLYQIESLCQKTDREDLSLNCTIDWSDSGLIKSIQYKKSRPANLVRRHQIHELYAADEAIRTDMTAMESRLSTSIEGVRMALDSKMEAMDLRLKAEDTRIEGKLDKAVTALQAADKALKRSDKKLNADIVAVRTDLTKSIDEEITKRGEEDVKLTTSITELTGTLNTFKETQGVTNKALSDEAASNLSTLRQDLAGLGDELRNSDKKIRKSIGNVRKALNRVGTSSKEATAAIERINADLKKLETLEAKDKIIDTMLEDLGKQVKSLLPPEKPEAPPVPEENQDENNTESPKP